MYVVREVLSCRPGQVGEMVKRFRTLSEVMRRLGHKPFRLATDVAGAPFWTLVAETEVEQVGDFVAIEARVMADPEAQRAMAGYHDLLISGRRELYKLED